MHSCGCSKRVAFYIVLEKLKLNNYVVLPAVSAHSDIIFQNNNEETMRLCGLEGAIYIKGKRLNLRRLEKLGALEDINKSRKKSWFKKLFGG